MIISTSNVCTPTSTACQASSEPSAMPPMPVMTWTPRGVQSIGRLPGVRKGCVAVFGATDPAAGTERLVVVAETREQGREARQSIARAITEQVAQAIGLPPDAVQLLRQHSIPKTSSGKLQRYACRTAFLNGSLATLVGGGNADAVSP